MKRNVKRMSIFTLALIIAMVPMFIVNAEENHNEYVTIDYDNSIPTNQDVEITIEVTDEASGVDKLIYINEEIEENINLEDESGIKKGKFTAEENGEYKFKAYDIAGNETLAKIVITNIDKVLPELTLTPSTTNPTNQDVVITATATDNVEIAKIILPDNTEVEINIADYPVTENGTYSFKAIDTAGNEIVQTIEISNINKIKPEITIDYDDDIQEWTNQDITVTATVTKGTLNKESHTFTENGSFTFTVEDEHGNTEEYTVTITKIDKTPPKINIKIVK